MNREQLQQAAIDHEETPMTAPTDHKLLEIRVTLDFDQVRDVKVGELPAVAMTHIGVDYDRVYLVGGTLDINPDPRRVSGRSVIDLDLVVYVQEDTDG